jgi:23S rRNA pseudouridine1911/1915/1917 synthase
MIELSVPNEHAGERLDRYLALALPQFSRTRLQALIRAGDVQLQGHAAETRDTVHAGDVVRLIEPQLEEINAQPEEIPLEFLFEDGDLLVINKPAGLVVHPGAGNRTHTIVNALLHHCTSLSGIGGKERPGIVHRLDKETSGCLVVAKNDAAHQHLSGQFAQREGKKNLSRPCCRNTETNTRNDRCADRPASGSTQENGSRPNARSSCEN